LSNFASNNYIGIRLRQASNSTITHNTATSNTYGVYAEASDNNNISGNNITNNFDGIDLYSSSNNSISENNITNNSWNGVDLELSISNEIYHNNFINNTSQVSSDRSPNTWDNGYPSGGNYWSDYKGTDLYSGPYQNVIGSDGIGDTPYVIDANNTDYYPLMKLYVRILGDINGDDRVDMKDIGIAAKAFGSHCANYDYLGEAASPNWNPMCDLNGDGKIDLRDIALIARHFGQHYP
jgi:parallel beta-helix repeat protein